MKKKIITIVAIIVILACAVVLMLTHKNNQIDISKYHILWTIYDQNISNIKNNMEPITVANEDFYWWKLKDFNIDDKEYQQILNNLVADIRMCYLENTDNGEFYTNSNPIKVYRDKENITKEDLNVLASRMKESSCFNRFDKYSSLLISNNPDTRKILLDKIDNIIQIKNTELFHKEIPTYHELLTQKIVEVTMVNNLSSWVNSEYYRLKNNT